jgi:hypothetical protein
MWLLEYMTIRMLQKACSVLLGLQADSTVTAAASWCTCTPRCGTSGMRGMQCTATQCWGFKARAARTVATLATACTSCHALYLTMTFIGQALVLRDHPWHVRVTGS